MPNTTEQCLSRVTTATFEELALLFPETELTDEQAAAPLDVAVLVNFRGPEPGRLLLRASECILPTIAANMLGAEQSGATPLQRDALGELANVICGNVLPAIFGADAIFHLDAPRLIEPGYMPVRDDDHPAARVHFGVENGRTEALLFLFGNAPARPRPVPPPAA